MAKEKYTEGLKLLNTRSFSAAKEKFQEAYNISESAEFRTELSICIEVTAVAMEAQNLLDSQKFLEAHSKFINAFSTTSNIRELKNIMSNFCIDAAKQVSIDKASKIHKQAVELHQKHGKENYEAALEKYNEAIKLNPNSALYYTNKAIILTNLGRLKEACSAASKALKTDTDYQNQKDAKIIAEVIIQNIAMRNNKSKYKAFYQKYTTEDYKSVLEKYNETIKLNSNLVCYYTNKAIFLNALGRSQEALDSAAEALKIDNTYQVSQEQQKIAKSMIAEVKKTYYEAINLHDKPHTTENYRISSDQKILNKIESALERSAYEGVPSPSTDPLIPLFPLESEIQLLGETV